MLIKESKEQASAKTQISDAREAELPSVPAEIGMEETIRILTTNPHEKIEFTSAHRKSEEKFFSKVDAVAKSLDGPEDASENHDKYIYGKSRSTQ